ncbi:Myosin light chain kinase (MLCK) [Ectocarpus siliculosus]|uniref:Myosin light chain kinase (MLCK) n=1 Tax=Ectocarpus siliculosus TaxID=2880 RepID=D8LEF0_ECTSI|nr:Myosin light chain kinase (MLCK) [Ectocarpus siliculosus]|eukprot:CBN74237.1 Myosin light chain kinase (MLCK) [Ectocarpus siliculosus]
MRSGMRRLEEKAISSMYSKDDGKDRDMVGIKVGDFEAKNFYRYFSLGDQLGQGASGKVFKGTIKKKGKGGGKMLCAIKRVRKFHLKERKKQALFREVQILRGLDHPNIVKIYQFYPKDTGYYYVVMEFLLGGELFDHVVKKDTYNEREARDVCKQLVDAMGYIHSRGIVHRDLRPGNLLLAAQGAGASGSLKIADFGKAMSVREGPVTTNGGAPEFVAPEVLLGKPHDTSPDMWSIGLIAFMLLSGAHPFFEPDTTKMFIRVAAADYQFKPTEWRNISGEAQDFISNLLVVATTKRLTAEQAKSHPWLLASAESLEARDLCDNLQTFKVFNAKRKLRATMKTVLAARRMFSWLPTDEFSKAYQLGNMLGEGAYGMVFKATPALPASLSEEEDGADDGSAAAPREYAVKRIKREGLSDQEEQEVIAEANIMRELDHPNLVSIYDFYQDDPKFFYMVLELMEGGELFDRIVQKQYYNEAEARDVCLTFLEAMKYTHGQGVVHRDLKPENLLLASKSDDSSIRLADFGFAVSVLDGYVTDQCGTPGYVAPEILRSRPYGTSVDMWSIGVIIYIILAGYPPFHDEDQNRLYRKIKAGHYRFDPEYWNDVSSEAKDLIRKLLTVDPTRRLTAAEACEHPWLSTARGNLTQHDLGAGLEKLKIFNATRKLRAAIRSVLLSKKIARDLGLTPTI